MSEHVFRPGTRIFIDFLKNTMKIIKTLNSILLLLSFLGLNSWRAYFFYTEQWYANRKVHLKWLMSKKGLKIDFFRSLHLKSIFLIYRPMVCYKQGSFKMALVWKKAEIWFVWGPHAGLHTFVHFVWRIQTNWLKGMKKHIPGRFQILSILNKHP